jgi:Leucine-rich repeat (LRR) protein
MHAPGSLVLLAIAFLSQASAGCVFSNSALTGQKKVLESCTCTTGQTFLGLHNQGVHAITPGAFEHCNSVTELDLSSNKIAALSAETFTGLRNLTKLCLSSNKIAALAAGIFTGLGKLTELELENNKIASLETGTFTGLASLTRVGLGLLPTETYTFDPGSDRQHLAGVRFSSLRGVLEGCRFAVTPNQKVLESCFCTSGQTTLDLSRQGLTGIKPGAFEHCESLTKLILRFNNNIKQGAFDEGAFDWLGNRGDGDVHFVGLGLSFDEQNVGLPKEGKNMNKTKVYF